MAKTKIEWTDESWNPVTGCDAVSPGCDNCYAKKQANRLHAMGQTNYKNNFKVTCHSHMLNKPNGWKKPRRIFVNSMSDLFHHDVPDEFLLAIMLQIMKNPQHIFQILTKRPERALRYLGDSQVNYTGSLITKADIENNRFIPPNLWLGVSAENQKYADKRIPQLLQISAAIRFVSFEPLLGEIDLSEKSELYYYCKECNWVGDIGLSIEKDDSDFCPICIKKKITIVLQLQLEPSCIFCKNLPSISFVHRTQCTCLLLP